MMISPLKFSSEAEIAEFVSKIEHSFEERLVDLIRAVNKENLKFAGLTGPTCSGKTTLANKIIEYMEAHDKQVCVISIDDFFYDRDILLEKTKIEGNEEIDFDSVNTIDLDAIEKTIEAIERGEIFELPRYDFKTGKRAEYRKTDPKDYDLFLFEGIQVL